MLLCTCIPVYCEVLFDFNTFLVSIESYSRAMNDLRNDLKKQPIIKVQFHYTSSIVVCIMPL